MKYLGHIIGNGEIRMNPKKIADLAIEFSVRRTELVIVSNITQIYAYR